MIKTELSAFAVGAKIDKIYLPSKYELVFSLRSRAGTKKLYINVGGNAPRVCFTEQTPQNPAKPPMLCMLLRKLLTGAAVSGIRQQGLDRILFIDLAGTSEIGDKTDYTLVIEIMAQYSNCILLNAQGVIIDSVKRVDAAKSSYREVLPQREYRLPPAQDKLNLLECASPVSPERILRFPEKSLSSALLSSFSGVSPLLAKELAYRVCLGDAAVSSLAPAQLQRLSTELTQLKEQLASGISEPCYLTDETGELLSFSFLPLTYMANGAKINRCETLSALLDLFYAEKEKKLRARAQAEDLYKTVNALLERTAKKINVRRSELPDDETIEEKRVSAELINVYASSLPKGVTQYEIPNYYDENRIKTIKASPELSPQRNAQKYYKEYKKAQTAKKVLAEQIENGVKELSYLQTVQDALSRAETYGELTEIREELRRTGFMKANAQAKAKQPPVMPPLEFISPGGFRVLVGRNNLQNDKLSLKLAEKTDLWFHVQKAPGSHVVLQPSGGAPGQADYEYAAGLAVWFSSVRERGKAEVDYTQVKNLKKPPASAPGFVIYHVYKTIYAAAVKP